MKLVIKKWPFLVNPQYYVLFYDFICWLVLSIRRVRVIVCILISAFVRIESTAEQLLFLCATITTIIILSSLVDGHA